jgi:uncharacterized protein (DUF58 family)
VRRRAVVFLISDFQTPPFQGPLQIVRHRHDLIPVLVQDERESRLPPVRYIELFDPETGEQILVDTSSRAFRERFADRARLRREALLTDLRRLRLDAIQVATGDSFIEPLRRFFHGRERRR